MRDEHGRIRRGGTALALVAALALGACQGTAPAPTPTGSAGPSGATGATGATNQAGFVLRHQGTLITKGVTLAQTCGSTPISERTATFFGEKSRIIVPPGTRLRITDGASYLLCPGAAYTPKVVHPAQQGRQAFRYRIWVDNGSEHPISARDVATSVNTAGTPVNLSRPEVFDTGGYEWGTALILPGESATWEIVLALPADGQGYVGDYTVGALIGWSLRDGVTAGPPAPVELPAPTPTPPAPRLLPTPPAGLSVDADGVVRGPTASLPHRCRGLPPTGELSLERLDTSRPQAAPGSSVVVKDSFRATLCPGEPYTPSAGVVPSGPLTYRSFTAFVTNLSPTRDFDVAEFFMAVVDAKGNAIPGTGRVFDPGLVPYVSRGSFTSGETVMVTFAIAIPSGGAPARLSIEGSQSPVFTIS